MGGGPGEHGEVRQGPRDEVIRQRHDESEKPGEGLSYDVLKFRFNSYSQLQNLIEKFKWRNKCTYNLAQR